jgi:uncharacterized protein (TIGR00369 family)
MADVIDDWGDAPPLNDFTLQFGPLQRKRQEDGWAYAMRVDSRHRNEAGLMHGGALTAFIDEAVGTIVAEKAGRPHVTVQLSASFLHPVQVGDLVELACEIVKVTRSMAFVEVRLTVLGEIVATAHLIFKAMPTIEATDRTAFETVQPSREALSLPSSGRAGS